MGWDVKIAHIREDGTEQTVLDHLRGVAERMVPFTAAFPQYADEQARLIGLLHDIGKYADDFQARIRGREIRVDHSTAGAKECFARRSAYGAFCVAGHHAGLADFGSKLAAGDSATLQGRLKKTVPNYEAWKSEVALPDAKAPVLPNAYDDAFLTRMLFSALVDADYLDTEAFMRPDVQRPTFASPAQLEAKLTAYVSGWRPPKNALNEKRCEILDACIAAGNGARGLYKLSVPTGGGKTVSSLAFALRHAVEHGMKRVIYVIPYVSIIEQTADIFREIFGAENVLECHASATIDQRDDEDTARAMLRLSAENFDAPIVVTTNVQFFESLYSNRPSKCRKLHNFADSVLIFDEAQVLPLPYLKPCVRAIETLIKQYGATAVLCTATQPALDKFFSENITPREICPNTAALYEFFRRVTYKSIGRLTTEQLAEEMSLSRAALAIVNTRKQARELYEALPADGRYHLTTLMTPLHRRKILSEVRERLRDGLTCRLAATSLIEAGVDVSFPVVFREEAGLDSVIQAAGRCNRERETSSDESFVNIFTTDDKPPKMLAQHVGVFHETLENHPDLSAPDTVTAYFDAFYEIKGDGLDSKHIVSSFEKGEFRFADVAKNFKLIESNAHTVLIPLDEKAQRYAAAIRAGYITRKDMRNAGLYAVSLYKNQFEALVKRGCVEPIDEDYAILTDLSLYNEATGLNVDPPQGDGIIF